MINVTIANGGTCIMRCFAHRGDSSNFPENTLLAFEEAKSLEVAGIEFDVHKSKDGKLVVIHDEDIQRTFLGSGLVGNYTYDELRSFKNRKKYFRENSNCTIPLLEEVLLLIQDSTLIINIEIKTDEIEYENIEEDTIEMIKKYNFEDRTIISSFNHKTIKKCKEIAPEIKVGLLYEKKIPEVISYAKSYGAEYIHPSKKLVSKELIEDAHKNGIGVNVYTVNKPRDILKMYQLNVDGIFSDYPNLFFEVIK